MHPNQEELITYRHERDELEHWRRIQIRQHLRNCSKCRSEITPFSNAEIVETFFAALEESEPKHEKKKSVTFIPIAAAFAGLLAVILLFNGLMQHFGPQSEVAVNLNESTKQQQVQKESQLSQLNNISPDDSSYKEDFNVKKTSKVVLEQTNNKNQHLTKTRSKEMIQSQFQLQQKNFRRQHNKRLELSINSNQGQKADSKSNQLEATDFARQANSNSQEKEIATLLRSVPEVILSLRNPSEAAVRSTTEKPYTKESFQLLNPIGEVVKDAQPLFQWQNHDNVKKYTISIYDSQYNEIASETVKSLRTPVSSLKLNRNLPSGKSYMWRVTAETVDGKKIISPRPPQLPPVFHVASSDVLTKLDKLEKRRTDAPQNEGQLNIALYLIKQGMLTEAISSLQNYLNHNPNSLSAKKLLAQVKDWKKTAVSLANNKSENQR